MAWEFDGGYLAPGESVTWALWWGEAPNDYMGIQVIQALPERPGSVVVIAGKPRLTVTSPALQLEEDGGYTYFITVSNDSDGDWYQYRVRGQRVD
jgi:hypothetical protein